MNEISDEHFFRAVIEADRRLHQSGSKMHERRWQIGNKTREVLELPKLVSQGTLKSDNVQVSAENILKELYGERVFSGNFGVGLTAFRGIGYLFNLPLAAGEVKLNPFAYTDLTNAQKNIINQDSKLSQKFLGEFKCAFQSNCRNASSSTEKFTEKSKFGRECLRQFRSACFIIAQTNDHADAYQSSCLALELGLKEFLLGHGCSSESLKKGYGHNLAKLWSKVTEFIRPDSVDEISQIFSEAPKFVDNRFGNDPITSAKALEFCLDAQFILSELSIAQFGACFQNE